MDLDITINRDKEIGLRIRTVRKNYKLSQEKMAEILGIHSTTHYQNIEYGKCRVTVSHLQILNDYFKASPNYILLGIVGSEQEYIYDFLGRPTEEKVEIFTEIARQAFGGQQNNREIRFKET